MSIKDIKYILICGAGMMGKNIAFVMASNPDFQIGVYDLYETDVPAGIRKNTESLIAKGALTQAELEDSHAPSPLLTKLRDEGKLGFKTGEGFQTWTPEQVAASSAALNEYLVNMLYGK